MLTPATETPGFQQSPRDPFAIYGDGVAAYAQFVGRNYQEAIALAQEATRQRGDLTCALSVLTGRGRMTGQIQTAGPHFTSCVRMSR